MTSQLTVREPPTFSELLASYDAGTLANQSDATLLTFQTALDKAVDESHKWARLMRDILDDTPTADLDTFLEPTLANAAKLAEVSDFITRTTTVRYGCAD